MDVIENKRINYRRLRVSPYHAYAETHVLDRKSGLTCCNGEALPAKWHESVRKAGLERNAICLLGDRPSVFAQPHGSYAGDHGMAPLLTLKHTVSTVKLRR